MLASELVSLINQIKQKRTEEQRIELKKADKGTPQRLYDILSSFSNQSGGGIIVFGIDEDNQYNVCGVYDPKDLQVQVNNQAKQMTPVVRPLFTVAQYEGKVVVSAEIAECDIYEKPCFYTGAGRMKGSCVRCGDSDEPMTEYEVYSYEVFKRGIQDELNPVERAELSDLDSNRLTLYLAKIKQEKRNLSLLPEDKILKLQGITDGVKPTIAGMMVLGEYPQGFFPQLSITAMVIAGKEIGDLGQNQERFIDNKRIEGTIPQMLEESISFVSRNMKVSTIINEEGKRVDLPEYPLKAIRELILNALVHRDYSIHTVNSPIRIILYHNRLEVENPGGLYGRITIDNLGKVSADTRNPFISGALELLIDTENRFSGIPTVLNEMEQAGLYPPVFESRRGCFKATLYNERVQAIDLNNGNSIKSRILEYCSEPRTREEIARYLNIEAQYYMVVKYLKPLIAEGKLRMTIPDRPKSKKQKYVCV
ncbi:MAG: AAA family ATPase [Ruminiclostridium sp.]|nr:AAA family ATPase [Ruminiclostridium sp.]